MQMFAQSSATETSLVVSKYITPVNHTLLAKTAFDFHWFPFLPSIKGNIFLVAIYCRKLSPPVADPYTGQPQGKLYIEPSFPDFEEVLEF